MPPGAVAGRREGRWTFHPGPVTATESAIQAAGGTVVGGQG